MERIATKPVTHYTCRGRYFSLHFLSFYDYLLDIFSLKITHIYEVVYCSTYNDAIIWIGTIKRDLNLFPSFILRVREKNWMNPYMTKFILYMQTRMHAKINA